MKKRILVFILAIVLAAVPLSACQPASPATPAPAQNEAPAENKPAEAAPAPVKEEAPAGAPVELTLSSWRPDDTAAMNKLLDEYKKVAPNVTIKYQPINPPDYNATLRLQLDSGTGPDLTYARSYATGQELFAAGHFFDCTSIPGLMDNFTPTNLEPWQMPDSGKMFAVPFAAVSHGVYYNKDIFKANGLSVPNTWDEFMNVCQTLSDKGITPLANGVADEWDILECVFLSMLPDYIGGADQRALYEKGEKKINDENFVKAYTDIASLAKYMPKGFEAVTYNDSQAMFNTQQAAMFLDGSWTISVYDGVTFDWGVFAVPAHKAEDTIVVFHPDMAIAMNAKTAHPEEAKAFLAWLCTQEGVTTASKSLPIGFFPMINFPITLDDPHANEFLALNEGRKTDARFIWPNMIDLYAPMNQAIISTLKGDLTPQAAADSIAALVQ